MVQNKNMQQLKNIIKEAYAKEKRNLFTFLTGAGISVDSGIPTYRGSDGIWVKGTKFHKPQEFGTYRYFLEHPEEVWQYSLFRKKMIEEAKPNKGHFFVAEIEQLLGERFQLITQNIDNLHRRAGSERIYEIHGNYREVKCSGGCKEILPMPPLKGKDLTEDLTQNDIDALKCPSCGKWVRPNVLWFDEVYDEKTNKLHSSLKVAKTSGVLFVIGTSGATTLPMRIAQTTYRYGGHVIDINLEDNAFTGLTEKKQGMIIREKSTVILEQIKDIIVEVTSDV